MSLGERALSTHSFLLPMAVGGSRGIVGTDPVPKPGVSSTPPSKKRDRTGGPPDMYSSNYGFIFFTPPKQWDPPWSVHEPPCTVPPSRHGGSCKIHFRKLSSLIFWQAAQLELRVNSLVARTYLLYVGVCIVCPRVEPVGR